MAGITDTYSNIAIKSPDKIAIQTQNEKISYQMWLELITKTANWLESRNLSTKTLGILLPNGIPFLQLFTGAAAAGWIAVPFDARWTETELQKRITLSGTSLVITTKDKLPFLKNLSAAVKVWEDCVEEISQAPGTRKANLSYSELPFYMGFTSGSTGEPKAFIRSQNSWVASFDCTCVDFQINESDSVLIPGPLIHSHFLYGAISTLYLGGTVYLMEKFSAKQALAFIESDPITVIYVVPTMIAAFLKEDHNIKKPMKILSSGAKWEENSKQEIRKVFMNLTMYEFYGASELSFVTVLSDVDSTRKPGSVGKPCHNVEIQIRRMDGACAKRNEPGKIYVKSEMIFIGYLHDQQNRVRDEQGWITVDDMGYLDEDGYLFIAGREKNMILYGGINIFPEEIEKVLAMHPDVEEAAVVGLQDAYWGQVVVAAVKGSASLMELKKFCRENLASFKIPRKWIFVNELPHTTSGKISRPLVIDLIESKVSSHGTSSDCPSKTNANS